MADHVLSPAARQDLVEIWQYVAEDNLSAADKLLTKLETALQRLAERPHLGHRRPDLTDQKVLFWPVGSLLVIYRDLAPIEIVRVLSGYRDVAAILSTSSNSEV